MNVHLDLNLIIILVPIGFICALVFFLVGLILVQSKMTSVLPLCLLLEVSVRAPHCGDCKSYNS